MTTHDTPKQGILDAARKLNERRMGAIDRIASTRARIGEIQALMTEAEQEDARAYADALKAGWTPEDLKAVGIAAPARQTPGRPRRRSTKERVADGELGIGALLGAQVRREAEASVRLDGETHVIGEPVGASA